jgi:hypothetical protein
MPTHNEHDEHKHASAGEGFEATDVSVSGIIVFLVALSLFVTVFFAFCFGMGKVINTALTKRDGPPNKWNASDNTAGGKLNLMTPSPQMQQQQLAQLTQRFPMPRVQGDDGNQDTADLHAREDLLLEHYSWVDRGQGKVRIPIKRAMELIAQRGLPVAPSPVTTAPLMTADSKPTVQAPLTDGFARTSYEQEAAESLKQAVSLENEKK